MSQHSDPFDVLSIPPLRTRRRGEPTYSIALPSNLACFAKLDPAQLRWVSIEGDGNDPEFRHGDVVVIELRTEAIDGSMHVVGLGDGVALRRVHAAVGGGWRVGCDRDPKVFETVPKVPIVGVVACRVSRY